MQTNGASNRSKDIRRRGSGIKPSCCSGLSSCFQASASSSSRSSRSSPKPKWWSRIWSRTESAATPEEGLPQRSLYEETADAEDVSSTQVSSTQKLLAPSRVHVSPGRDLTLSKLAECELDSLGLTSSDSSLQARIGAKKALVKACLLELAQRGEKLKKSTQARAIRREALNLGHEPRAFASPKRNFRDQAGSGSRQLVPAMVLPRWESWEAFSTVCIEDAKLRMLEVRNPGRPGGLRRLGCLICGRATGGGEAIMALPCAHIFCPVCFEAFLRKRWADLASNLVDSSETDQIPCPLCRKTLQRQDVHTLTEPELIELAARVEQAHRVPEQLQPSASPGESPYAAQEIIKLAARVERACASSTASSDAAESTTSSAMVQLDTEEPLRQLSSEERSAFDAAPPPAQIRSGLEPAGEEQVPAAPPPTPQKDASVLVGSANAPIANGTTSAPVATSTANALFSTPAQQRRAAPPRVLQPRNRISEVARPCLVNRMSSQDGPPSTIASKDQLRVYEAQKPVSSQSVLPQTPLSSTKFVVPGASPIAPTKVSAISPVASTKVPGISPVSSSKFVVQGASKAVGITAAFASMGGSGSEAIRTKAGSQAYHQHVERTRNMWLESLSKKQTVS